MSYFDNSASSYNPNLYVHPNSPPHIYQKQVTQPQSDTLHYETKEIFDLDSQSIQLRREDISQGAYDPIPYNAANIYEQTSYNFQYDEFPVGKSIHQEESQNFILETEFEMSDNLVPKTTSIIQSDGPIIPEVPSTRYDLQYWNQFPVERNLHHGESQNFIPAMKSGMSTGSPVPTVAPIIPPYNIQYGHPYGVDTSSNRENISPVPTVISTMTKPFACIQCKRSFSQSRSLTNHNNRFHFATDEAYVLHLAKRSAVDEPFKCNQCPKQFYYIDDFKRHIQSDHRTLRKFICSICSRRFLRRGHLVRHELTHTRGTARNINKENSNKTFLSDNVEASPYSKSNMDESIVDDAFIIN